MQLEKVQYTATSFTAVCFSLLSRLLVVLFAAAVSLTVPAAVLAQQRAQTGTQARSATKTLAGESEALRETVTVVADVPIPNLPGKRLVSRVIDYPPGGGSAPHRHARTAFLYAYVLSGEIRSQVDDEPVRVYRPGETWFEKPGSYHRVSENASDTKPARLLAVLIVDAADKQLVIPDPQSKN